MTTMTFEEATKTVKTSTASRLAERSTKVSLAKLRVKLKSLAAEARIIRLEEHRIYHKEQWRRDSMRGSLTYHRKRIVRPEMRATLLAYAIMRGKRYKQVEQHTMQAIPAKRIAEILKSVCWVYSVDTADAIREWTEAEQ